MAVRTTTLSKLERPDGWAPIRKELGVRAFGVNAWTAREAGAAVIPEHDEQPSGHEELYLVVAGGQEISAEPGYSVEAERLAPGEATTVHWRRDAGRLLAD